jgi:hypothetical protein
MDAQQRVPSADYSRGISIAIRHSPLATYHSPLKNTAPACETQTGAAIKQTN